MYHHIACLIPAYLDHNSSSMLPIFVANPTTMCLQVDSFSKAAVSLNNADISTSRNIYSPKRNISMKSIDLHENNPSSLVKTQTFCHLFDVQNYQRIDREIKRRRTMITPKQRFNFAKLADEVIKDKEDTSKSSTLSNVHYDVLQASLQSHPAAIISSISLLASNSNV